MLKLSRNLSEEQQRHVRENMTGEEFVILDILTRPAPELSDAEWAEVKKVARELLARLKQLLVLDWHRGLPHVPKSSSPSKTCSIRCRSLRPTALCQKCSALFEHIFESYPEPGAGVYATVG